MQDIKLQDMKMLDTKRRHEIIVYLLCIYRVLVRNAEFGAACFIGFVRKGLMFFFVLFSLRLPGCNENCHYRYC